MEKYDTKNGEVKLLYHYAKDINDMVFKDSDNYLLATDGGIFEVKDGELGQRQLYDKMIQCIVKIKSNEYIICNNADKELQVYNSESKQITKTIAKGNFISAKKATMNSFVAKSYQGVYFIYNLKAQPLYDI